MRGKGFVTRGTILPVAVALVFLAATGLAVAGHVAQEVSHDNDHAWKIQLVGPTASVTFVPGPPTCSGALAMTDSPPLGTGSVRLFVADGAESARLRSTRFHGTRLDDLITLEYWACMTQNNGQQFPYIVLNLDNDGDNQTDDFLIFEPPYQDPIDGNPNLFECPHQGQETLGQWQHWDAKNGCWWSVFNPTVASPGTGVQPLRDYLVAFPNATIVNASGNVGGLRFAVGDGDPVPHEGYVDGVEIATKKIVYDMDNP